MAVMVYCNNCQFWVQRPNMPEWGECRKNAPVPYTDTSGNQNMIGPANYRGLWPYVRGVDFCFSGQSRTQAIQPMVQDQALVPHKSFNDLVRGAKTRRGNQ